MEPSSYHRRNPASQSKQRQSRAGTYSIDVGQIKRRFRGLDKSKQVRQQQARAAGTQASKPSAPVNGEASTSSAGSNDQANGTSEHGASGAALNGDAKAAEKANEQADEERDDSKSPVAPATLTAEQMSALKAQIVAFRMLARNHPLPDQLRAPGIQTNSTVVLATSQAASSAPA